MKHIKLFEQFEEDEEESWWDNESPFDVIKDLKVIKSSNNYYLAKIYKEKFFIYNMDDVYSIKYFNIKPIYFEDSMINTFDPGGKQYRNMLKDLPKEIKDRIDLSEISYH